MWNVATLARLPGHCLTPCLNPCLTPCLTPCRPAEAWALATVNRLDLNVLPDYRWPRLLAQADAFVAQARCCVGGVCRGGHA